MEVTVRVATILLGKARPPLDSRQFPLSLPDGTDVSGLITKLGIPPTLVGSVTVNKKRSDRDRALAEGDTVTLIPSISGG